jgi:hypothetical protein
MMRLSLHINRVDHHFAKPLLLHMPMKNILRSVLGGIVAAVIAVVAQAADLAPGAFSAGTVKGDVTYKLAGTSQYLALTPGTSLPQGATIKTGANSLAIVVFSNGAAATVRPNSEVEISKFEQEVFSGPIPSGSEPSVSKTEIKVINGSVASKVSKLKQGSSYVVNTPVGAAGVRGTVFNVTYNAATGAYSVSTTEGAVVFTKNADGTEIEITAGQVFNGQELQPLTREQIEAIEAAIRGDIESRSGDIGADGQGPRGQGPYFPDVDTSISVSIN